jgi:mannobiose 2-epimerase
VDHSLRYGWDHDKGGFYYIAFKEMDRVRIFDPHKAWWTEAEGLNALMMMEEKYPGEGYKEKFLELWSYTDKYLIDKEYGGWYNYGLDNFPENRYHKKAHNWKASYHNVRAMLRCIEMLDY